jgi:HEAT repeat protein
LGNLGSERAIEPLLARLDDPDASVRRSVAYALGNLGSERAIEPLLAWLDDPDASMRIMALEALARGVEQEDRRLLSLNLDGVLSFLDPREIISVHRADEVALRLGLSSEDVRARYEALAPQFRLRLGWKLGAFGEEPQE